MDTLEDVRVADERHEEFSSLLAIFPEMVVDSFVATLDLQVAPVEPVGVVFSPTIRGRLHDTVPHSDEVNGDDVHFLSYLPPITLRVELPFGYPTREPPVLTLSSSPAWIPHATLQRLQSEGIALWRDLGQDQIIYAFIDHVQQAAERVFDLADTNANGEARVAASANLRIAMLDYDMQAKTEDFNRQTFECGVCLDPKKGSTCFRLPCSHVFCVKCLQDFYNTCIAEGDVNSVKCIDPDCGKSSGVVPGVAETAGPKKKREVILGPTVLLQIPLEASVVKRFVDLKRKAEAEADPSTVYCTRTWCQGVARTSELSKEGAREKTKGKSTGTDGGKSRGSEEEEEEGEEEEDSRERLAICTVCGLAFCRICKAVWHGDLLECRPPNPALVTAEEQASEEYLLHHSSACPTCSARCQKTSGCNHMICVKCRTHFCYLCGAWLEEHNPYAHYNTLHNGCYMRLWELEEGDGVDESAPAANNHRGAEAIQAPAAAVEAGRPQGIGGRPRDAAPAPAPAPAPGARVPLPRAVDHEHNPGLRRFLELVENDEEDEWDSDEMGEEGDLDGDEWDIPLRW
ncbi:MAG: translation termination inhibitor protein itt1 [Thelocarpon superellum]|nr:MAG: translation termination inhibitor protein itt1 [Thelocarpon superellum]